MRNFRAALAALAMSLLLVPGVQAAAPTNADQAAISSFLEKNAATVKPSLEMQRPLTAAEQERVLTIGRDLRCMVCGNQSIVDSQNENALVIRHALEEQVRLGKTDAEITSYMVNRFGEEVLFEPLFTMKTLLLWLLPLVFLLLAAAVWLRFTGKNRSASAPVNDQDLAWAHEVLAGKWRLHNGQFEASAQEGPCTK